MDRAERFWDNRAERFDERSPQFQQTYLRTLENTKKHLNGGDLVLDYGCGTGNFALDLAGHVKEIRGIDLSSKMIAAAMRKAVEHQTENVHFTHATLFDDGSAPESFDVVLAFNILHLVEDPPQVMHKIHELLRSGGLLVSSTPCLGENMSFFSFLIRILGKLGIVPHLKNYKIADLEHLLANRNFQPVKSEIIDQAPPSYFVVARKN